MAGIDAIFGGNPSGTRVDQKEIEFLRIDTSRRVRKWSLAGEAAATQFL